MRVSSRFFLSIDVHTVNTKISTYELGNLLWMYEVISSDFSLLRRFDTGDWFYEFRHKLEDLQRKFLGAGISIPRPIHRPA